MMTRIPCLFFAAALPAAAQSVTSDPIGFNKVTCLANSDTIVGVPLRKEGSQQTLLTAPPVIDGDSATLTLSATNLETLANHYLKFNSGAKDGSWFDITANTSGSVTINLNGESLGDADAGDSVTIAEYWTLDTLFPPAGATTGWTETPAGSGNWVPNGHAIMASAGTAPAARRTQVLLPNNTSLGVNRPSLDVFYINSSTGAWVKSGGSETPPGATVLYPDSSFIIRHNSAVPRATIFRATGEVVMTNHTVVLLSKPLTQGYNDNHVAIPRPIDVSLAALNLVQSGAFTPSAGTSPAARRDQLLVFNNGIAQVNKPADKVYYYIDYADPALTDKWILVGDAAQAPQDDTFIPAGAGIIVRKYNTAGGISVYWRNSPSYN